MSKKCLYAAGCCGILFAYCINITQNELKKGVKK